MIKFGIIGHPVSHTKSPELFAKAYGSKWQYEVIDEPCFEDALNRFQKDPEILAVNVTAPFKLDAARAAGFKAPEVMECGAANILIKADDPKIGLRAYNSDYTAVRMLLDGTECEDVAVVGFGGAGKAAYYAAKSLAKSVRVLHHDELAEEPLKADIIVFTLPRAVPGYEKMECRVLIEANYKDPVCRDLPGIDWYIPGEKWLMAQAISGWRIMTGEDPNI